MVEITCEKCGTKLTVSKRAAVRKRFCPECAYINHQKRVAVHDLKKKEMRKTATKLCSCGCGRSVGEGLRFLSTYCYKTKGEWRMKEPDEKPEVVLVGEDGNAFSILGRVSKALYNAGADEEYIDQYRTEATSGDYDNLLVVTMKYVDVL